MGLLSFLKRHPDTAQEAPPAAQPDAVAAARTRARRRLIGATVLLGIGVVGFPLLFETQPRPIPVNIPIEIPRKDGLPPLQLPAAAPPLAPASDAVLTREPAQPADAPAEPVAAAPARAPEITERAGEQGRELPPPVAALARPAASAARPVDKAAERPADKPAKPASQAVAKPPAAPAATPPAAKPAASLPVTKLADKPKTPDKPAEKPADKAHGQHAADAKPPAKPADDGARAKALLDGQAAASAAAARVVVQVGAYGDGAKLAEARQKLEKLGLKTYTQVVTVDGAKRTRVRVGPFASKAEADKAAARIKAAGLPVAILTL